MLRSRLASYRRRLRASFLLRFLNPSTLLIASLVTLIVLSGPLTNGVLLPVAAAAAITPLSSPQANMTVQQFLKEHPTTTTPFVFPKTAPALPTKGESHGLSPAQAPPSAEPATMQPLSVPLTSSFLAGQVGVKPADLRGSDGRMELQVQPGALDLSTAALASGAKPVGPLTLRLNQTQGHFVGQLSVLGVYTLSILDAQGHPVSGARLRTPVTLIYHYQPSEMTRFDLDPGKLFLTYPSLIAAARAAHQLVSDFTIPLQNDPVAHTLTARSPLITVVPFDMGGGDAQNQSPPAPHLASVQGNAGQLTYSYPLTVAPGPPGTTPSLTLSYNSGNTNGRSSTTSTTDSVGEGWSLSMGSISADQYPSGSAQAGT